MSLLFHTIVQYVFVIMLLVAILSLTAGAVGAGFESSLKELVKSWNKQLGSRYIGRTKAEEVMPQKPLKREDLEVC